MNHHCNRDLFVSELNDLLNNPEIQRMAGYEQHQGNTTLQHVLNVAMVSFRIADRLGLDIDERALAKARSCTTSISTISGNRLSDYRHGVSHRNWRSGSEEGDALNKREYHPQPYVAADLFHPPQSKEAVVVMMADKYCAVRKWLSGRKRSDKVRPLLL